MFLSKENSSFRNSSHCRSPYSRPYSSNTNTTVSRILSKPRSSENNYNRSHHPARPLATNNSGIHRFNESTPLYSNDSSYSFRDDVSIITSCTNMRSTEPAHFRPRKSQFGNRLFDNTLDESLELKMMSLADETTYDNAKRSKLNDNSFQIKTRQSLLRIFTGSVENILHWSKLKTNHHILFEVTGTIVREAPGKSHLEKIFWLGDSNSSFKLQVIYYEIDRPLVKFSINSLVTCIGRLISSNRLQAYKMEECSAETRNSLQRVSYLCNRVADEIASADQNNGKKNTF